MHLFNEMVFLLYSSVACLAVLTALRMGKEALISLIGVTAVLANLLVGKQILLGGFNATASDALAIAATLSLNVLQEFYGRQAAFKAIWISFSGLLFYTIISQLHLWYIPSPCDVLNHAYYLILHNMPRIACASLLVYFIVQQLDCRLYAFFKKRYEGKHFVVRNLFSIACTQLVDTILFTFIGLYGIVSHIPNIIALSYFIKLIALIIAIPFLSLAKKVYKP